MYSDFEDLIREIEEFRQRIKDNGRLCGVLENVLMQLKEQKDISEEQYREFLGQIKSEHAEYAKMISKSNKDFMEASDSLQRNVSSLPAEIIKQSQMLNKELISQIRTEHEGYSKMISESNKSFANTSNELQKSLSSVPREISERTGTLNSDLLQQIKKEVDIYVTTLKDTENEIKKLQTQLENKYNEFLCKLDTINVAEIYNCCTRMNKSLNVKTGIVIGGVALALVLSILSFFI